MKFHLASAALSLGLAASALAQTSVEPVENGIDACPAFDIIQQRILEVVRGVSFEGSEDVAPEGEGPIAVQFILDASGSMGASAGNRTKMEIARTAFINALDVIENANIIASLRAYGFDSSVEHTAEASCPNTEQLTGFLSGDMSAMGAAAADLSPYGYTPIATSLEAAAADLASQEARERLIVLLSDGEETCHGDPVATAASLRNQAINVSAYVVGFDLDPEQEAQMRAVAEAAGGRYINAPDADALAEAMREVAGMTVSRSERQLIRCENPVEGGLTPETAIPLEPGIYTIGELLPRGEYRYFRIDTAEGEMGVVRGLLQSYAYTGEDDSAVESAASLGAMTIRILDPQGERAGSGFPRERNLPGESLTGYYVDTSGEGFIIGIGDNYERTSPLSLFEIAIEDASDNGAGDADSEREGVYPALAPGETGTGLIGHDDLIDLWQIDVSGPVDVLVDLENDEMRFGVTVFDADTGRRVQRERPEPGEHSFAIEADAPVIVEISTQEPRLASRHSRYRISISER
ncbi:VWA domain-containing protein [Hyphobacterium sp. HN65]|uniref:VWA domain-containing protein n=1 Tax=Hyphobacterium lacteum TaxID=3116575 RepID=A0ABU7LPE5_9PROT|nr:VWA domain-containing protein [Hyphobacterium sp. HN65]MEE2525496.1 VWA domain-containing protein [Hyphobacterium sp. HN65]